MLAGVIRASVKDVASARGHGAGGRQRRALQSPSIRQLGQAARPRSGAAPQDFWVSWGDSDQLSAVCRAAAGGRVLGGGAVPGPRWPVAGRGRSQGESQHLQEALDGRSGVTASAPSFKDGHLAWEAEVAASVPSLGTESRVGESLSEPDRGLRGLVVLRSPGREKAKWWVPTPWWRGPFLPSRQLRGRVTWGPGPGGIGT